MKLTKFAAFTLIALAPAFANAQSTSTTTTVTTPTTTTVVTPATSSSHSSTTHTSSVTDLKTEKNMTPDGKNAFEAERSAATDTNPKPVEVTGSTTESTTTTTESHSTAH